MVAIGAAIAGGEEHFVRLLNAVAKKREGRRDDLDVIDRARVAVAAKKLTPRHLHELTDVIVRAWKLGGGAYDEQIAEMIRESGYTPVKIGTTKPRELVEHLREREVVPLSIVVPYEGERIPHVTLLWKDARGTIRLYDSDDIGGSHVLPRGSAPYEDRLSRSDSSWDLAEKYR